MSRYTIPSTNEAHVVTIGYDRPFNSYFASVFDETDVIFDIERTEIEDLKRDLKPFVPEIPARALEMMAEEIAHPIPSLTQRIMDFREPEAELHVVNSVGDLSAVGGPTYPSSTALKPKNGFNL